MGDLVHMFVVIEGLGGDNDEPDACCMNHKVRQEAIWRPDGGVCERCHLPECRHTMEIPEMSHYPLRKMIVTWTPKINCCSGILIVVTEDFDPQPEVLGFSPCVFFLCPCLGGPVQHSERGWTRLSRVRQHVCAQQLQTRPESSQAGARRVCGE